MDRVGEQDDEGLRDGVDPDGCAGEAGVSVRQASGEKLAAIPRIAGVDIPAEAAYIFLSDGRLRRSEIVDGERTEDARAVERAAIEHHLAETGEVVGGGEEAGIARDAAHEARSGVV